MKGFNADFRRYLYEKKRKFFGLYSADHIFS